MKRTSLVLSLLLLSSLSFAQIREYECEYKYDNKTFKFSVNISSDHIRNTLRFYQVVAPEYVIFDSEDKPISIEGNPIFPLTIYGDFNEISYNGWFRAEWNHAYTDFNFYSDSCELTYSNF